MIKSDDEACIVSVTMSTYFCLGPCANSFFGHVGMMTGSPHMYPEGSTTLRSWSIECQNPCFFKTPLIYMIHPILLLCQVNSSMECIDGWNSPPNVPWVEDVGNSCPFGNMFPKPVAAHLCPNIKNLYGTGGAMATLGPLRYLGCQAGFLCSASWKCTNAKERVCNTIQDKRSSKAVMDIGHCL